jgi:hypothetical protein
MNNINSTTTISLGQSYGCTCSHVVHVTKESNLIVTYCSKCGKILDYAQVNTNYFGGTYVSTDLTTTPPQSTFTISGTGTDTIVSKGATSCTTPGIYKFDCCESLHEI